MRLDLMIVATLVLLSGCEARDRLVLPPGDIDAGRTAFVETGCSTCHSVQGSVEKAEPGHPEIHVVLGGVVTQVDSHERVVVSIINPDHRIAPFANNPQNVDEDGHSRMLNFNSTMTVQGTHRHHRVPAGFLRAAAAGLRLPQLPVRVGR